MTTDEERELFYAFVHDPHNPEIAKAFYEMVGPAPPDVIEERIYQDDPEVDSGLLDSGRSGSSPISPAKTTTPESRTKYHLMGTQKDRTTVLETDILQDENTVKYGTLEDTS